MVASSRMEGVRKSIQSIEETVGNKSEDDKCMARKETNMNPNETAQKLLNEDTKIGWSIVEEKEEEEEKRRARALFEFLKNTQPEPESILDLRMAGLLHMLRENSQCFDVFTRECLEIYTDRRDKIKEILKNVDGKISLAVEVVSSEKGDKMRLTAQYIDQCWILRNIVLEFSPLGGEGNYCLSEVILRSLKDWQIEDKVWTFTVVNGSLYNEAFQAIKVNSCRSGLNSKLFLVHCCADMIKKLVVQEGYERISEVLDDIEELYSFENAVLSWENKFKHLKEAMAKAQSESFVGTPLLYPSNNDWKKVSDICDLAKNIYDLVFPLFEKGSQSADAYLRDLFEVQYYLKRKVTGSNRFKKDVANNMLQTVEMYVDEMHFLLATASLMDPRLKMQHLNFSTSKLHESVWVSDQMMLVLSRSVKVFYDEYVAARYPVTESCFGDGAPKLLQEYIWFAQSTSKAAVKTELEKYLEEPVVDWSRDFDVLRWWKNVGSTKYPMLAKMARDFLAIPFTTAVKNEALLIEKREAEACIASIQPNIANAIMCIRSWFLDQNLDLSS